MEGEHRQDEDEPERAPLGLVGSIAALAFLASGAAELEVDADEGVLAVGGRLDLRVDDLELDEGPVEMSL